MKDKTEKYLDLTDNLGVLSDKDIKQILEDDEMREIHNVISKTIYALTDTEQPDINKEWERFSQKHYPCKQQNIISLVSKFVSRNVAAVTLYVVTSLAVVAATIGIHISFKQTCPLPDKVEKEAPIINKYSDSIDTTSEPLSAQTEAERIIFKNRPLSHIISIIADYYGVRSEFKSETTKRLRLYFQWDQSLSLKEVIGQLDNFEQLDIKLTDNTIIIE